jgi:large subunit ribosomal protein L15
MVKNMPDHFGVHGFKRPPSTVRKAVIINVGELEEKFPGKKTIDLTKEGFDKLLGKGTPGDNLKISVKHASAHAVQKVKDKGGDVTIVE